MMIDDARKRILAAAEDLFYAKGFAAVGMDELRAAADVSLRRVYALFPSKGDIVVAVLNEKHEEWESGLTAHVAAAGGSPREQLLAVYDYLEDWFCTESFRGCAFINAFGELGGTHPEVAQLVREHKESFQRFMASLVRELGVPSSLAVQLSILAEGAQSTAAIAHDPSAASHAKAAAVVLIDAELSRLR